MNLISNAIRYTDHGTVTIRLWRPSAAPSGARITVADSGRGMAPEQVARLFQAFGQVHEGTQEGAGLGLHLSRLLVEAHGGTLRLQSAGKDQGTTATVDLPVKSAVRGETPGVTDT
ncbi:MAG: sensor histidine kinase [Thermoplasmatota archaeon]